MLKNIALAAVVVLAVGCGAARPQRSTQDFSTAASMWARGDSLTAIKTSLSLRDEAQAKAYVGQGIMLSYERYQDVR
jgi:hypothetical protein